MPWNAEDWQEWPLDGMSCECDPAHARALHELLHRLPGRRFERALYLGCSPRLSGRLSRVDSAALDSEVLAKIDRRFDLVVTAAVDSVRRSPETDRLLTHVRRLLVEGGIFLATFAARADNRAPFAMIPAAPAGPGQETGFHEFELQYRLWRAGFQGIRIRRFPEDLGRPATILCMAVRRALN